MGTLSHQNSKAGLLVGFWVGSDEFDVLSFLQQPSIQMGHRERLPR
jgi:hypothetical protein